jgi:hypothetical protein
MYQHREMTIEQCRDMVTWEVVSYHNPSLASEAAEDRREGLLVHAVPGHALSEARNVLGCSRPFMGFGRLGVIVATFFDDRNCACE